MDEGFALGQACSRGQGICLRDGTTRCGQNGQLECSALPGVGRAETCDGRDEDCDGRTDEGFPVGQPCEAGVGECYRAGMLQCAIGGGTQCSVQAGAPRAERCDAVDNDCDGRSDEGLNLGQACIAGAGQCEAEGTLACGQAGAVICQAEQPMGGAEECDDLDNDCDGRVDEGGVCPDLEPPDVALLLEPVFVLFNGLARVTVTVTDDQDPDPQVTATIDGMPIPLDANGQYLYQANEAGAHEVVAVAVDAAGRRGEARDYFRVQNLDDNEPPVVRIIAPADTSELTGVTEIHGRLEDPNFFSWKLEISFDQQNWQVINTGMTSGPDVIVGSIDPTVMAPGFVYVRLTGEDENSLNQFQIVTYRVPDGVSLGETKLGIRDFEMPVKGFSLAFDREYDSRRKYLDGDFGFGWKLTATRVEVREDLQSNVMVALPDGRREVFAIAYNFPGFFPFGTMSYVAPP
ncbi:MAG: hypothetical protein KC549_07875, partial [Myxococcales bacterium]|nr:hypothetical protein [Myxococcales bacterium]